MLKSGFAFALILFICSNQVQGSRFGMVTIRPLTNQFQQQSCSCDNSLNQVCCGGKTFINECQARCEGYYQCVACPDEGFCPENYDPVVCMAEAFPNLCFARQSGYMDRDCCSSKSNCTPTYLPCCN